MAAAGDADEEAKGGWMCTLSTHMRSVSRVLAAFDKIGRDLFIDAQPDCLMLRTLNAGQSVFCLCSLPAQLFEHYQVDDQPPPGVKIWLKLLSPLFRSQHVQSTSLQLVNNGPSSYVRVQLTCTSGLVKLFDLGYEEMVPVNAMYEKEACPHRLRADPRLLLDCVTNLPAGVYELTLSVTPHELVVKNDVDDHEVESAVRTEMSVAPGDLHEFTVGPLASNPLRVTFGTREFKAMLQFAEASGTSVTVHFDVGGRPLILVCDVDEGIPGERLCLECVIATVVDQDAAAKEIFGDEEDFALPRDEVPSEQACGNLGPDLERTGGTFPSPAPGSMPQDQPTPVSLPGHRDPSNAWPEVDPNWPASVSGGRPDPHLDSGPDPDPDLLHGCADDVAEVAASGQGGRPEAPGRHGALDNVSSFPSRKPDANGCPSPLDRIATSNPTFNVTSNQPAPAVRAEAPNPSTHANGTVGAAGAHSQQHTEPSDTDDDDNAIGGTPQGSPEAKRVCTGFVEEFGIPPASRR